MASDPHTLTEVKLSTGFRGSWNERRTEDGDRCVIKAKPSDKQSQMQLQNLVHETHHTTQLGASYPAGLKKKKPC